MRNIIVLTNQNPFSYLADHSADAVTDTEILGLSTETFQLMQAAAVGFLVIALLVSTFRYGLKKEYTATERKGWFWPDVVFKLIMIVVVCNFPYLFGLAHQIMRLVAVF